MTKLKKHGIKTKRDCKIAAGALQEFFHPINSTNAPLLAIAMLEHLESKGMEIRMKGAK